MHQLPQNNPSEQAYKAFMQFHLGNQFSYSGCLRLAKKELSLGRDLNSDHLMYFRELGQAYQFQDDFPRAIQAFNAAVEHEPQDIAARFRRGRCLIEMREYKKAFEDFDCIPQTSAYYKRLQMYACAKCQFLARGYTNN